MFNFLKTSFLFTIIILSVMTKAYHDNQIDAFASSSINPQQFFWWHQQNITSTTANALFGSSCALSGNLLAVGAATQSFVFLYTLQSDRLWNPIQQLTNGNSQSSYGSAVALSNQYLVVGATKGATAYIYQVTSSQGLWTLQQQLTVQDKSSYYGNAIAMTGTTIAIGAQGFNGNTGAVFLYVYSSRSTWTQSQMLTPSDQSTSYSFGQSIGVQTFCLAIGTYAQDGFVFIYGNSGSSSIVVQWTLLQTLQVRSQYSPSYFGTTVSLLTNQLVVGAYAANDYQGMVFVYTPLSDGSSLWQVQQQLAGSSPAGQFGLNLAVSPTGEDLVVAAPYEANSLGAAYSYVVSGDSSNPWTQLQSLVSSDPASMYGLSIALSSSNLVIGAPRARTRNGAVYSFVHNPDEIIPSPRPTFIPTLAPVVIAPTQEPTRRPTSVSAKAVASAFSRLAIAPLPIAGFVLICAVVSLVVRRAFAAEVSEMGSLPLEVLDIGLKCGNLYVGLEALINSYSYKPWLAVFILLVLSKSLIVLFWVRMAWGAAFPKTIGLGYDDYIPVLLYPPALRDYNYLGTFIFAILSLCCTVDLTLVRLLPWTRTQFTLVVQGYPCIFVLYSALRASIFGAAFQAFAGIVAIITYLPRCPLSFVFTASFTAISVLNVAVAVVAFTVSFQQTYFATTITGVSDSTAFSDWMQAPQLQRDTAYLDAEALDDDAFAGEWRKRHKADWETASASEVAAGVASMLLGIPRRNKPKKSRRRSAKDRQLPQRDADADGGIQLNQPGGKAVKSSKKRQKALRTSSAFAGKLMKKSGGRGGFDDSGSESGDSNADSDLMGGGRGWIDQVDSSTGGESVTGGGGRGWLDAVDSSTGGESIRGGGQGWLDFASSVGDPEDPDERGNSGYSKPANRSNFFTF